MEPEKISLTQLAEHMDSSIIDVTLLKLLARVKDVIGDHGEFLDVVGDINDRLVARSEREHELREAVLSLRVIGNGVNCSYVNASALQALFGLVEL
jgi:hypothetical protein